MVDVDIETRIDQLKSLLEKTVESHHFNFQHADVVSISQQLDILIIKAMKKSSTFKQSKK